MSKNTSALIAPSILAADFGNLGDEIVSVDQAGADWLHIDVMDGRFVPPITFGANVVKTAAAHSQLFRDVHLMIAEPERHLETFQQAGAQLLTVHQEACPHLHRTLSEIRALGMKSGVALNPGTSVDTIIDILEICDLVLVMTVNPGWGGQTFIEHCLDKISLLRSTIDTKGFDTLIEVDGGVNKATAKACLTAGANILVAGTHIFAQADRSAAIESLRV